MCRRAAQSLIRLVTAPRTRPVTTSRLPRPFIHASTLGAVPDGGVVKTGAGNLTFSGTVPIPGPTGQRQHLTISNAMLAADSIVTIASGGILDLEFAGNNTVLALVLGGVAMPAGTYNAASTPAYFTGTGSLLLLDNGANIHAKHDKALLVAVKEGYLNVVPIIT